MTGGGELQIVRTWIVHAADTGEGMNYECSNGSTWRDIGPFKPALETGVTTGKRYGDRIILD